MKLVPLPKETLPKYWPVVAPFAEKYAAKYPDEWSVEIIAARAQSEAILLWLIVDEEAKKARAALGTRIVLSPAKKRILVVSWLAGEGAKEWISLIHDLEEYGRTIGCEETEIDGRYEWRKLLPDYRIEKRAVFRKALV